MKDLRSKILDLRFFILISILGFFASCEKPVEPTPDKPLSLTLSADSVLCLPIYKDLPALDLAWTAGSNHGTGSAIAYTIEMDTVGANFAGGLKWEIGRTADRTLVFSHKQLADTLSLTYPDIPEGQYTRFEWRVKAVVLQQKKNKFRNRWLFQSHGGRLCSLTSISSGTLRLTDGTSAALHR